MAILKRELSLFGNMKIEVLRLSGLTGSFETSIARPLAVKIVREQASACPTAANERVYYAASQTLGENKIANKTFGYIVSNAGTSTTVTAMVIGF